MKKIMTAHQPNFLPYLGFFDKMRKADIFIIGDNDQFVDGDFIHRNKIKTPGRHRKSLLPNSKWLTVPVYKARKPIDEIKIKKDVIRQNYLWNILMLKQIKSSYETAPFFHKYFPELEEILSDPREFLIDLNMRLIEFLRKSFGIETEMIYQTDIPGFKKIGNPSDEIAGMCKATHAEVYLSGPGGKDYLDTKPFTQGGIEVVFQNFYHPTYEQRFEGFLPKMSSIDALFNVGKFPVRENGVLSNTEIEDALIV